MRIANPYNNLCRIANPTQRPTLRTSPRTESTPFFSLKLVYVQDEMVSATLNGKPLA